MLADHARFLRFLAAGGTSAVLNLSSRWLFGQVVSYELSVALAYVVGVVSAFLLMRLFVFDASEGSAQGQFMRFVLVNLFGFVVVWVVSVGLARLVFPAIGFTWHAETLAHFLGISCLALTSYQGHRLFSFRTRGLPGPGAALADGAATLPGDGDDARSRRHPGLEVGPAG